jgi:hypothetical protein
MSKKKRDNEIRRPDEGREEFAQEVTPAGPIWAHDRMDRVENREGAAEGRGLGIAAIVLSILAFFFLPFIMAPAGIIVGVIAARRGSALGWWATGIGVIALIVSALVLPFRILF